MSVAETTLRKTLQHIVEENKKSGEISIKALTSGGANYTSLLYSAIITFPDEEWELFAKVGNVTGQLREVINADLLFQTEMYVYTDLIKAYERIQEKHNLATKDRYMFPKYYGGSSVVGEETVVMENLVAKGYEPYSRFKSIDWDHIAGAVSTLARFHALSFAYQKEEPENFDKAAQKLKWVIKDRSKDPAMAETASKMMGGAVAVSDEEHKEKVKGLLLNESSAQMFDRFKTPLSTPVFCHGDYRVSNLLFRSKNSKPEAIVVDYQTVHTGSPVSDLLYLEFLGTDQEFRKENHQRLIDYYFTQLTEALDNVGIDVNEVYPREVYEKELKELLPMALFMAAIILPYVLVEAGQAPHFGVAESVQDCAISPTQLFAERFRDLVNDCVRWGVL